MIHQPLYTLSGSSLYQASALKTLTPPVLTVLVETLITARSILSVMKFSFQLPIEQSRRFHIDYPEILLMSAIVVAAKLCFPLGQHAPFLRAAGTEQSIRFDWRTWFKGAQELIEASQTPGKEPIFNQVTADQVTSMATEELDQYFAHIASTIDRKSEFIPGHQNNTNKWKMIRKSPGSLYQRRHLLQRLLQEKTLNKIMTTRCGRSLVKQLQ